MTAGLSRVLAPRGAKRARERAAPRSENRAKANGARNAESPPGARTSGRPSGPSKLVPPVGLEPTTSGLRIRCSTD
jgi:hypothetical protein